jgi:hypothetical protein
MTDTIDRLVTEDLAELAAAKRHALRGVEQTMQAVVAARPAAESTPPHPAALAVLALGTVFARRVGRAASGAVLLVGTLTAVVTMTNPFGIDPDLDRSVWIGWDPYALAARGIFLAMAAGVLARWLAETAFEHHLRAACARGDEPRATGARLVRSVDGLAIGLGLAGVAAFAICLGALALVCEGWEGIDVFWRTPDQFGPVARDTTAMYADRLRDLVIALVPVVAMAAAVGRACARETSRPSRLLMMFSRRATSAAILIAAATLFVAFRWAPRGVGVIGQPPHDVLVWASSALRPAVLAIEAPAWFTLVAGLLLARRRAENERLTAAR